MESRLTIKKTYQKNKYKIQKQSSLNASDYSDYVVFHTTKIFTEMLLCFNALGPKCFMDICFFYFSPLCVFKCLLKSPACKDA